MRERIHPARRTDFVLGNSWATLKLTAGFTCRTGKCGSREGDVACGERTGSRPSLCRAARFYVICCSIEGAAWSAFITPASRVIPAEQDEIAGGRRSYSLDLPAFFRRWFIPGRCGCGDEDPGRWQPDDGTGKNVCDCDSIIKGYNLGTAPVWPLRAGRAEISDFAAARAKGS